MAKKDLDHIRKFFRRDPCAWLIDRVTEAVGGDKELVVVGGVLRELLLESVLGKRPRMRDLDIVVLGNFDMEGCASRLGRGACELNTFGGLKWIGRGLEVDIWPILLQTRLMHQAPRKTYTPKDVVALMDLTVNGAAYMPRSGRADLSVALRSIGQRSLELHSELVGPDYVCVARFILMNQRLWPLGFRVGPRLKAFVRTTAQRMSSADIERAEQYYGRKRGWLGRRISAPYFERQVALLRRP
jgi:hypothetical protein